jgi:hypothetical protein
VGIVRLCQRAAASCGACCGIYNRTELDREAVRAELQRHTRALARAARTPEGFREAARRLEADAPQALFPSIRVCQLVGYLDARETRIGCLAHPKATGGVDLRGCGVYDVETCESFLCPSHALLSERDAAVVEAVTDPHLFGLVATDGPFVRAVLEALARELGAPVEPALLVGAAAIALGRLFALKEELEAGSDGLFGPFRHVGADRSHAGASDAAEAIVAALGADERSGNDQELLESEARQRFAACVATLRPPRPRRK